MIDEYPKYFQKSLFFLYPLLNIKGRDIEVPKNSYLILPDEFISEKDYKLICHFKKVKLYDIFEKKYITPHPLLESILTPENEEEDALYVFNLSSFKKDIDLFLKGKYARLSFKVKKNIINFYSTKNKVYDYMDSFLFPVDYYEVYSDILNVPVSILKETEELTDVYDKEKETCPIKLKKLVFTTTLQNFD